MGHNWPIKTGGRRREQTKTVKRVWNLCAHTHVFTFPTPVVGILDRAMLGTLWIKLHFLKSQDSSILSSQPFYQLRQCLPATHRCLGLTPGAQAVHSPDNAAICRVRRWGGAVGGGWHGEWGREGLGGAESIHVSSHWHVSAHHRNWTEAGGIEKVTRLSFPSIQGSSLPCWVLPESCGFFFSFVLFLFVCFCGEGWPNFSLSCHTLYA